MASRGRVQSSAHVAGDVDDVRVVLVHHQLGDSHGAVGADLAEVVALEIDEHDVLGPFLRVEIELAGEVVVLGPACAARAGPGDGSRLGPAVGAERDKALRRGGDELVVAKVEIARKGRGIHGAQGVVEVQARQRVAQVEALREVGLEDVAGEHILTGALDRRLVLPAAEVGAEDGEIVAVDVRDRGSASACEGGADARSLESRGAIVGAHPVDEERLARRDVVAQELCPARRRRYREVRGRRRSCPAGSPDSARRRRR